MLFKTGKVLQQRGLDKFAANCEAMRQEVEAFKKMVPLVVVSWCPSGTLKCGLWWAWRDAGVGGNAACKGAPLDQADGAADGREWLPSWHLQVCALAGLEG